VDQRRVIDVRFASYSAGRRTSLDFRVGRIARLETSLRERPESAPKPPFHCEPEIGFTALSGHMACFIASLGVGCPGAFSWAATSDGGLGTMVVTHRHILLLALLLASPIVARAAQAAEGPATVPRLEPAPCPKLQGAETLADASCGYLVVLEDRSRPNGRAIRQPEWLEKCRSPATCAAR